MRPELLFLPSSTMKSLFACLLLVVSVTLAVEGLSAAAAPELTELRDRYVDPGPLNCCINFMRRPIPLNFLKTFDYSNVRCSKPAVIFLTKRDLQICTDPSEQWVQDRIRALSPF